MTSFLLRLCLLMVAAFGSRPCGVPGVERAQAPFTVGLRAREVTDLDARTREPATPSIGAIVRGAAAVRAASSSNGGSANGVAAEGVAWPTHLVVASLRRERIARRTPCAACGDGTPYDATAPPIRV